MCCDINARVVQILFIWMYVRKRAGEEVKYVDRK